MHAGLKIGLNHVKKKKKKKHNITALKGIINQSEILD